MTHKAKILVVDDEDRNVKLLKAILLTERYDAIGVSSGQEAIDAVSRLEPDLVLLDVMMPGMDGFEVCRRLKRDDRTKGIPVIMVTALREQEHRVRAMEAGADDFLSKPVDKTELLIRVKSLLRIKRYRDDLLRSYQELEEKNHRLVELEKAKEGLIHMIIHDLKNPLGAIKASIDLAMMDKEDLTEVHLRALNRCAEYGEEMNRQIESLLTIHRMENSELTLERMPTDMVSLVEGVLAQVLSSANTKGISLFSSHQDPIPLAEVDRGLIERVMANLFYNAIRHTPPGGSVAVRMEGAAESGRLRISVQDSGAGLPQEYFDKIFDKFQQARLKIEGVSLGTSGLGLAFCKMALEAHGGRIWVESGGLGQGCTFRLELPAQS
ncbi:MAG: response regulator [Thermodesulfobacteriota bacterium]